MRRYFSVIASPAGLQSLRNPIIFLTLTAHFVNAIGAKVAKRVVIRSIATLSHSCRPLVLAVPTTLCLIIRLTFSLVVDAPLLSGDERSRPYSCYTRRCNGSCNRKECIQTVDVNGCGARLPICPSRYHTCRRIWNLEWPPMQYIHARFRHDKLFTSFLS